MAKPEPLIRTSGGSKRLHKQFCEGSPGMAESRSPTAVRGLGEVKEVKDVRD